MGRDIWLQLGQLSKAEPSLILVTRKAISLSSALLTKSMLISPVLGQATVWKCWADSVLFLKRGENFAITEE